MHHLEKKMFVAISDVTVHHNAVPLIYERKIELVQVAKRGRLTKNNSVSSNYRVPPHPFGIAERIPTLKRGESQKTYRMVASTWDRVVIHCDDISCWICWSMAAVCSFVFGHFCEPSRRHR